MVLSDLLYYTSRIIQETMEDKFNRGGCQLSPASKKASIEESREEDAIKIFFPQTLCQIEESLLLLCIRDHLSPGTNPILPTTSV